MKEQEWELYSQILSSENIVLKYSERAKTAYFNMETREITVPVFEFMTPDVTQLLVSHEIAHALYSKYSVDETKIYIDLYGDLFNVAEDARVENRIKREYNGLKALFPIAYECLWKKGFFETPERTIPELNLISRLNLYYKVGHILDIPFSKEESMFPVRMKQLITNQDVIQFCQDLIDYLEKNENNEKDTKDIKEDKTGNRLKNSLEEYGEREYLKQDIKNDVKYVLSSKEAFENIKRYEYGKIKLSNYIQTLTNTVKEVARNAVMLFEQRKKADELKNTRKRMTGYLDMRRIATYNTSDMIFRQKRILKEGKNHAVIVLVDYSSSMEDCIKETLMQACVMGEFCKRTNIPFMIIAFGAEEGLHILGTSEQFSIPDILALSRKNGILTMTETPLIDAVIASTYVIDTYKNCGIEKTALFIVTDGAYTRTISIKNEHIGFDRIERAVIDNHFYDIKKLYDIKNKDWILEILFKNIRDRYDTLISMSFISPEEFRPYLSKNKLNDSLMDVFLPWKHSSVTKEDLHFNSDSDIISLDLKKNPFLNQFHIFFRYDGEDIRRYYKVLKFMALKFVESFS